MTKRQLIDEIITINNTAQPGFLARFEEQDLGEYLRHLVHARTTRLSGDSSRFQKYFRSQPRAAGVKTPMPAAPTLKPASVVQAPAPVEVAPIVAVAEPPAATVEAPIAAAPKPVVIETPAPVAAPEPVVAPALVPAVWDETGHADAAPVEKTEAEIDAEFEPAPQPQAEQDIAEDAHEVADVPYDGELADDSHEDITEPADEDADSQEPVLAGVAKDSDQASSPFAAKDDKKWLF